MEGQSATTDIRLKQITFDCVRFEVGYYPDDREVTVLVRSHNTWLQATSFPHVRDGTGESTGDAWLDYQIRVRASEELVRLAAAVDYARGRIAA
jgi:hypothetical protein